MGSFRNSIDTWGLVARLFHWLSALAILFLVAYGWWMTHAVERAGRLAHYQTHSLIGWYLLLFLALRLAWRAGNPAPDLPAELPRWERQTARAAHWGLYALMFAVSISGWMVADTFRTPIEGTLFGVRVPHIVTSRTYREAIEGTHMILSYALLALVVVHAASALRHHLSKRNRVLVRMWRGG